MTSYPKRWARATFGAGAGEGDRRASSRATASSRAAQARADRCRSFPLGAGGDRAGRRRVRRASWRAGMRSSTTCSTVRARVPAEQSDAFFQLVEHPILALANLYRLYYSVAWNRRLAAANDRARQRVRRPGRGRVQARPAHRRRVPRAQGRQVGRHDAADPHRLHHLAAARQGCDARGEARALRRSAAQGRSVSTPPVGPPRRIGNVIEAARFHARIQRQGPRRGA